MWDRSYFRTGVGSSGAQQELFYAEIDEAMKVSEGGGIDSEKIEKVFPLALWVVKVPKKFQLKDFKRLKNQNFRHWYGVDFRHIPTKPSVREFCL